jgi:6-phosphogluconolactonase
MANHIVTFTGMDKMARFFALKLVAHMRELPANRHFSLALSGGKTPQKVFGYLASHFRDLIDWNRILVFWSDERCVPPDSDESNFLMAEMNLLDLVPIPACNIFRIRGEADPEAEAVRYERLVRKHLSPDKENPRFDFLMLGLGEDGHTASIFPENIHLFHSEKLFEMSENPRSHQKRITATGKMINDSKCIIFLVSGDQKAGIVSRILNKEPGWEKLPASLVSLVSGNQFWLLDKAAASKLITTS